MTTSNMAFAEYSDYRNPGMPGETYAMDEHGTRDRPM